MAKTAVLKIEGNIGQKDPFWELIGLEDPTFSANDMSAFLEANKDADTIEIEIRSDGGMVSEAYDIHDQLKASGKRIVTKGYRVNSAATIPFLAAKPEDRHVSQNVEFIIHKPGVMDLPGWWNGNDLGDLKEDVDSTENKLLNFYAENLSANDATKQEIKTLMEASNGKGTDLGADNAIRLGFAAHILGGQQVKDTNSQRKAYAITNTIIQKSKIMAENKEVTKEELTGIKKVLANIGKRLNLKMEVETEEVKAATANLQDGTTIYFDGELAVDTKVFTDEAMETPAPDGDHVLEDGRTITVAGGVVTAIAEAVAASEEVQNLKDELAAKNTEIENLKAANAKLTQTENEIKASLTDAFNQIQALEKRIPVSSGLPEGTGTQNNRDLNPKPEEKKFGFFIKKASKN